MSDTVRISADLTVDHDLDLVLLEQHIDPEDDSSPVLIISMDSAVVIEKMRTALEEYDPDQAIMQIDLNVDLILTIKQ